MHTLSATIQKLEQSVVGNMILVIGFSTLATITLYGGIVLTVSLIDQAPSLSTLVDCAQGVKGLCFQSY